MDSIRIWTIYLFVQSPSRVQLLATPSTASRQALLPFTISWSLLKFMSIESVMASNHLIFCCLLLLVEEDHSIKNLPESRGYGRYSSQMGNRYLSTRKEWEKELGTQNLNVSVGIISVLRTTLQRMKYSDI